MALDNTFIIKDYGLWKELLPKKNYLRVGDTMWSSSSNEDYTVEKGQVSMQLPKIPFYAFGTDIIGGNFFGTNFVIKMTIEETGESAFDSADSGEKTIIINTKAELGNLYRVKLLLTQRNPSSKAVINQFCIFCVKQTSGWREIKAGSF